MVFVKRKDTPSFEHDRRKNSRDFEGLKRQLDASDPSVRRWAVKDIAIYDGASYVLVERLKQETCKDVREAIFSALIRIGDEVAIRGLVECLRSEDTSLRNEAVEALKLLIEKAAPVVRNLLREKDPDVRIFAINIFESLKHPDVEDWLIELIERDPDVNVCATAVDLLAEIGTERCTEPMERLLERFSTEPYIRFVVERAIRRIRGR